MCKSSRPFSSIRESYNISDDATMADTKKRWTCKEVEFVTRHALDMAPKDIADALGRSKTSVVLYMLRHDIARRQQVKRNLMRELIGTKINVAYFHPTREFYNSTGINQVRFQEIWQGYRQATNDEMSAVAKHLNCSRDELLKFFSSLQLELFD